MKRSKGMKKRISALLLSLVMLLALTVPVYAVEQQSPSVEEESTSMEPRMSLPYNGTTTLTAKYTISNKTYTYNLKIKITGTINDYNNYFTYLAPAVETGFSSGGPSVSHRMSVYSNEIEKGMGRQHITVTIDSGGQTIIHRWTVTANVGNSSLGRALIP